MNNIEKYSIVWNDYLIYRADLRGYDLSKIEEIIKFSPERYFDVSTHRMIAVGKHDNRLMMIPYELSKKSIIPGTIHATARQQINFRLKSGRFTYG
ncbi:MAG: hypothetical protein SVR08_05215 [Spirochaetota bacterium]|nr:hypothetical protein [Spirochaetota bacterium]